MNEEVALPETLRLGDPQVADRDGAAEQAEAQTSDRGLSPEDAGKLPVGDLYRA